MCASVFQGTNGFGGCAKIVAHFYHILFGFLDGVLDVEVGLGISNRVTNADGMT